MTTMSGHPLTSQSPVPPTDPRFEEVCWRQEQIEAAFKKMYDNQYRELSAKLASDPSVDLHRLTGAIENGCPPDLVRAIFT